MLLAPHFRNQRKKKALAETKTQFSKVADENRQLLKQLEDTQRENYQVGLAWTLKPPRMIGWRRYGTLWLGVCDELPWALAQVTEHLRRELLAKTERIASLEAELVKVRAQVLLC
jgi:hypothetical protein